MPRIIPRSEWGHLGPLGPARVATPATTLWLHHSVTRYENGWQAWRDIAEIGVRRFGRSSYSYVCSPDGSLGEMQGVYIGAHTRGHNSTTFAVVLPGNYEHDQVTAAQIEAVAWLHGDLVHRGLLAEDAPIRAHRDAPGASTLCPGHYGVAALPKIRAKLGQVISPPDPTPTPDPQRRTTVNVAMPLLRRRDEGGDVKSLQSLLNAKAGQGLAVDGDFGPATEKAVKNVQRFFKLSVDGIVGGQTWPTLFL